jgi:hypothetical protein
MERRDLLELVEILGRELERLGMSRQVETLRLYYLALVRRLDREHAVDVSWSEERTIDWLGILRLPPYADRYPVRDDAFRCPCTARTDRAPDLSHIARTIVAVEARFPGGKKVRCTSCGQGWLVLDGPEGGRQAR